MGALSRGGEGRLEEALMGWIERTGDRRSENRRSVWKALAKMLVGDIILLAVSETYEVWQNQGRKGGEREEDEEIYFPIYRQEEKGR